VVASEAVGPLDMESLDAALGLFPRDAVAFPRQRLAS
jgi:hypothetical protein